MACKLLLIPILVALVHAAAEENVPEGCVQIKNRALNKYLTQSKTYDAKRRHVSYGDKPEQWEITKDGENYRITHSVLKEEMYESELNQNGNYVFTWIPKEKTDGGAWKITVSSTGFFHIKNAKWDHCLWTKGWMGWIGAYKECDSTRYDWAITTAECKK